MDQDGWAREKSGRRLGMFDLVPNVHFDAELFPDLTRVWGLGERYSLSRVPAGHGRLW